MLPLADVKDCHFLPFYYRVCQKYCVFFSFSNKTYFWSIATLEVKQGLSDNLQKLHIFALIWWAGEWAEQIKLFVYGFHSLLSTNLIQASFNCKSFGNIKKRTPVTLELFLQFVTLQYLLVRIMHKCHFMPRNCKELINNVYIMRPADWIKREYHNRAIIMSHPVGDLSNKLW